MEQIEEGFDVFASNGDKAFGAVRSVAAEAIIIFVENSRDFNVPYFAIKEVHDGKVVLNMDQLDSDLQDAIRKAHMAEDPTIP